MKRLAQIIISKCSDCPSMVYLDGIQKTNFGKKKGRSQYCIYTKLYVSRDNIAKTCPFIIFPVSSKEEQK